MHEENHTHQRHDGALQSERPAQCLDGAVNQRGAVVHGLNRNTFWQTRCNLAEFGLNVMDDIECVLAMPSHHDAGNHLAFTIELGNATSLIRHQLNMGDIA